VASSDSGPPRELASVPPPQDLYQTSDIRFVMIELGKVGVCVRRQFMAVFSVEKDS
jgi:hypothetical protein